MSLLNWLLCLKNHLLGRGTAQPSAAGPYGKHVDGALMEAIVQAASRGRGWRRFPLIGNTEPEITAKFEFEALSINAREALRKAGYRDEISLADFRIADLGRFANQITLSDLDTVHRSRVAAAYSGSNLNAPLVAFLADMRVTPGVAIGYLEVCGGSLVPPTSGTRPVAEGALIDLREMPPLEFFQKILDFIEPDLIWDPKSPPFKGRVLIDGGDIDPSRLGVRELVLSADLLSPKQLGGVHVDPTTVRGLLSQPLYSGSIGTALVYAQALAAGGQHQAAHELAAHVARTELHELTPLEQYQVRAVAPAVVTSLGHTAQPSVALSAAATCLDEAVPGTQAAVLASRSAVRATRRLAAARVSAAAPSQSPGGRAARQLAERDLFATLTGAKLGGGAQAESTLAVQSCAALLDLMRATAAALTLGAAPGRISNEADAAFHRRLLPANGAAFIMGAGGLGALTDRVVAAHALGAWQQLNYSAFGLELPAERGDLFRFDYLLGEARRLLDDVAKIEGLLFNLNEMLLKQGLAVASDVSDVMAQLIDALTEKVAKLSEDVYAVLDQLVPKLRDAAFLNAVLNILRNWPHENWIELFNRTARRVSGGQNLVYALRDAMSDMLRADILVQLKFVAEDIGRHLDALTLEVQRVGLPDSLKNKLIQYLEKAGVPNPDGTVAEPLERALAAINLKARAQRLLEDLTDPHRTNIPEWAITLLLAYVAAPLVAAIAAVVVPLMLAPPLIHTAIAMELGLIVVGGLALATAGATVIGPILAFLAVAGAQVVTALVLHFLAHALGMAADIQREVKRAMERIHGLVGALVADLSKLGQLQALLDASLTEIGIVQGLLPADAAALLHDSLVAARTTVEGNLGFLLCAAERSFFRETLELVDVVPKASAPVLGASQEIVGFTDRRLGSTGKLAAALSAFERTRVERALAPPQLITQVFSLRQLLDFTPTTTPLGNLLGGGLVDFSITSKLLDTLTPGLHRALIKDVQVHVDFDFNSVNFDPSAVAEIQLEDVLLKGLKAAELVGLNKTVGDVIAAGLTPPTTSPPTPPPTLTDENRTQILAKGLESFGVSPPTAAQALAGLITTGMVAEGHKTASFIGSTAVLEDVILIGLRHSKLSGVAGLADALGVSLPELLSSALADAGVGATPTYVPPATMLAAGLRVLGEQELPAGLRALGEQKLSGLTIPQLIPQLIQPGLDALHVEGATGALVEAARAIAGADADPALDGRIPGGGFPGLPVIAGRVPTGLPLVLTHPGISQVRLRAPESLIQAYLDPCGSPLQPHELPCALRHTQLLEDESNEQAAEKGWRYLEFNDVPAHQLFSHFQILKDGVRFVAPEKQVKPFEYRGLIGNWSLQIPALVNGSVPQKLPPIRDIRLIVSAVAHFDEDLMHDVEQTSVELPEPPVPTLEVASLVGGQASSAPFTDLQSAIEDALDKLNQKLTGVIDNLTTTVDAALRDITEEVGRVRTGVDGLLDVTQLLAAVTTQLAAVTGVTGTLSSVKFISLTSADFTGNVEHLLAGTSRDASWTIDGPKLSSSGIDPQKVRRAVAAVLVPVAASVPLLSVTWPTGTGSLTTPATTPADTRVYTIGFGRGSSTVTLSDTSLIGTWNMTLPAGLPVLSDFIVAIFMEVAA